MELPSRERGPLRRLPPTLSVALALLVAALAAFALSAAERARAASTEAPASEESARVSAVVDGETLELADGRGLRLMGIIVPMPPLDAEPGRRWPLAERASAALRELALGRTVRLVFEGPRSDRYGRLLAQVYRDDGLWLEGELIARGLARVLTHKDARALAAEMLAREREAREHRRGLWATRAFRVLAPEEARRHLDSFELVEGKIESVRKSGTREFLRMGGDQGSGCTAILLPEGRRLFAQAGMRGEALSGRRVRVRGFLRWWNGPVIEVDHPEQIEVLGP